MKQVGPKMRQIIRQGDMPWHIRGAQVGAGFLWKEEPRLKSAQKHDMGLKPPN